MARLFSLYAEHSSSLRGLAIGMLGDRQQAEDVIQETMLRASRPENPQLSRNRRGCPATIRLASQEES